MATGQDAPPLLTERDEALVRDCAWSATVMMAWWAGEAIPVTRAEREALARAGGFPEGQEATDWNGLQAGLSSRYGWTAHYLEGPWSALEALPADAYTVLFGRYAALPAHFRRWDTFTGLHAVGYRPADGWWQDPEATPAAIAAGFAGETIPPAAARAYATAWPDGQVHALWMHRLEESVAAIPIGKLTPGQTIDLPKLTPLYDRPDHLQGPLPTATPAVPILASTGTGYLVIAFRGQLLLVKSNAGPIHPAPPPPPPPAADCTAAIAADRKLARIVYG